MRKIHINTLMFTAALAGLVPSVAAAQEAAKPGSLDEVVVTARRTGESLQKAPIAITAFSAAELDRTGVSSIVDLNTRTPSLYAVQSNSSPMGVQYNLRGQIQSDTAAFVATPVGVYLDDVFIGSAATTGSLINFDDAQRLEVLKGPQGTLYGRNVTGGVIRTVTNQPNMDEFEGWLEAGVGNYDQRTVSGMVNIPGDKVAFRGVASYKTHNGYSYDIRTKRDLNDVEMWNARGTVKIAPSERFNILLQGWYGEGSNSGIDQRIVYFQPGLTTAAMNIIVAERINGINAGTLAPLIFASSGNFSLAQIQAAQAAAVGALPQVAQFVQRSQAAPRDQTIGDPNYPQFTDTDTNGAALTLSWDFGDLTLKSITAYTEGTSKRSFNVGGFPTTTIITDQLGVTEQTTQEFQANGRALDGKLTYAAGLYYLSSDIEDTRDESSRDGAFIYLLGDRGLRVTSGSITKNLISIESWAAYGQATYALSSNFNVTGGLRYTDETMSTLSNGIQLGNLTNGFRDTCIGPAPSRATTPIANCAQPASAGFTNWSYTFGADWTVAPDVMIYGRTSRGFKAGGVNAFAAAYAPIAPFEPEQNTDYEVGVKSEWLDKRLRLNLAYYHTNYDQIQRTIAFEAAPGLIVTGIQNAATAKIDGAEFEGQFALTPSLRLVGTVAYTDAQYEDYRVKNASFPGGIKDQSSLPFQSLAKWTYNVGANSSFTLLSKDVYAEVNYAWRDDAVLFENDILPSTFGSTAFTPKQFLTQKAYGVVDASVSVDLTKSATLRVWGRNLADEEYFVSMIGLVNAGLGSAYANFGAPRTFGADLRLRF
ncbi:MAG: TonB-dependent receptor [Caulobacterales bacterium]